MKLSLKASLSFVSLLMLSVACGGRESGTAAGDGAAASAKPVTVKGSDTMVILGQRFAEEYMKQNPAAVIQVTGGGSGTGIAALINGTVDLAQASRSMSEEEKASAQKSRGAEVVERAVALDALSVFVNKANPVTSLSAEQLASIYMGKVRNWSEVGGSDAPIVLYGRESSSGTYDYFREHVLEKKDFAPAVQTLQGTAAVVNAVSKDPNGIGYGGIAYEANVRPLGIRAAGAGAAVEPSETTVADGSYPLSRKLFFYYASNAAERVKAFADWAVSPAGQAVVKNVGYFPLNVETAAGPDTASTATDTTATGMAGTGTAATTTR